MSITKKFFVGAFIAAFAFAVAPASAAYMHTVTLKAGSSGSQVMSLQQTLNMTSCALSAGAGSAGMETTTFGPKTTAAVKCFQAANGLVADGVVGPMTGAKLAAVTGGSVGCPAGMTCTPSTPVACPVGYTCTPAGGSTGSGSLDGTDGTIESVTELTQYSDEEVGEGEEDVIVAGFEIQTANDGDVLIRSVRVEFDPAGNGAGDSDKLDDYITGVKIWMGDEEVGSADVDDFSESSDIYTRTISLNNAVVGSDEEVEFFISVDGAGNLDSGDIDSDAWDVDVLNIRYEDGSGVVSTFDDAPLDAMDVEIDFVDFGTSANTELKVSTDSDSPDAGIVVIDEDDGEDDVVLLKGTIEIEGDSDVNLDELPVTFSPTEDNINVIASSLILVIDGEEYRENVPSIADGASATVTFDDLDLDIGAGDTVDFEVRADINGSNDFTGDDNATITASVTSTNRNNIDAENEEGENLSGGELSGTAIGEEQDFRSNGISVSLVSTSEESSSTENDNAGTFTIKFKVMAIGDDVYLATTAAAGVTYTVDYAGTATTTDISAVVVNNTDTDLTSGGTWLIEEGEEETITLTVVRTPSTVSDIYRAVLTGIKWDTDDDTSPDNTYSSNLDDFKTDYILLN